MNYYYLESLNYIIGAVAFLIILLVILAILLFSVKYFFAKLFLNALQVFNITHLMYWLQRMEKEGLTAPLHGYREMVKARKPKTFVDYQDIEEAAKRKI
jgi:hypothetical protein